MRTEERRALWRTTLIAALSAIVASAGVFWVTHLPTAADDRQTAFALALHDAVSAALLGKDLNSIEANALAKRNLEKLVAIVPGFDSSSVLAADTDAINRALATNEKTRGLRLITRGGHVAVGRTTRIAGAEVFAPADTPLRQAHDDDWLFAAGVVPLRALQERLLGEGLLGLIDHPELCPSVFRVEDARALGTVLDPIYSSAARSAVNNDALGEALLPLCRRERLRRMADVAMRQSKAAIPFPFVAGIRLDGGERRWIEKLQNPALMPGLGADARAHATGMAYSEDELDRKKTELGEATRVLLPRFFSEAALQAEAWRTLADGASLPPPTPALLGLVDADQAAGAARTLCVLQSVAHYSPLFLASLVDRFSIELWPPPEERSAALALLYAATGRAMPKEGVASWASLAAIAAALPNARVEACVTLTPPVISTADLDSLAALMLN